MGIALVIVVALAALLLFAATRPGEFRVQRSVRIQAAPGRVFANLDDFRRWTAWSPWEGLDPELQRTFSGAASGVGSVYEWQGNRKVGKGRMEITRADAPGRLIIKLDFLKPFEAHNTAEDPVHTFGPSLIGIGGGISPAPLPHHRTYGSVYGGSRS